MKIDERNIIEGLQDGNEESYIQLFREYYVPLCEYSRRYVNRKDVAEEIVSEVFFRIWKKRKLLHIKVSIKAYLFQSVCNNSLKYLQNFKKEENIEEFFNDNSIESIALAISEEKIEEQRVLMEELNLQLEEAINQLPTQQQRAFKLKRVEGKKNREVAEIMELSVKTVEMHLSKAMLTLRGKLIGYFSTFLLFILLK